MGFLIAGRIRLIRFANGQLNSESADLGQLWLIVIVCELLIAGRLGSFVRVLYSLSDSKNSSRD